MKKCNQQDEFKNLIAALSHEQQRHASIVYLKWLRLQEDLEDERWLLNSSEVTRESVAKLSNTAWITLKAGQYDKSLDYIWSAYEEVVKRRLEKHGSYVDELERLGKTDDPGPLF